MVTKREIRSEALKRRRALTQQEVIEKSRRITETVISHLWFLSADTILLYMDYNKEVMTAQMIEKGWELGKRIGVPKVHGETMEYYHITSFDDLEAGAYGIREPREGCRLIEADTEKNSGFLAIMPGVAFDAARNRIGYGGGYYDKYYENKSNINKIAVAFEAQMVAAIPAEPFDLKPDCIVTEKQLYCPD